MASRDFPLLLVSGFVRRGVRGRIAKPILKATLSFYNGLAHFVQPPRFVIDEDKVEALSHPMSWCNANATTFRVRRGPNYVDGQKVNSERSLYNGFRMRGFKTPRKIPGIWRYLSGDHLADTFKSEIAAFSVPAGCKWPLPPVLLLNIMLPDYKPEMGRAARSDGPGFQIVHYCHLR